MRELDIKQIYVDAFSSESLLSNQLIYAWSQDYHIHIAGIMLRGGIATVEDNLIGKM